jgi:hypothetical protein
MAGLELAASSRRAFRLLNLILPDWTNPLATAPGGVSTTAFHERQVRRSSRAECFNEIMEPDRPNFFVAA